MGYIGKKPTDVPLSSADIGDETIDSDAYVDGSIDNAHIADNAIDSEHYADGSIDNAHIADDAIDSEHYADGSIDNAHIADDAIDSEHYAAASIDTAHIATNQIDETLMKDAFVGDFTDATVTASDYFLHGDATDSGNTKKDTVQGILDLVSSAGITLGTPVVSTSGTAIDFTGIPAGTKHISVSASIVTTSGGSHMLVQLGDSGGFETTGYTGVGTYVGTSSGGTQYTAGFGTGGGMSSAVLSGSWTLTLVDASTYTWSASLMAEPGASSTLNYLNSGSKSLSSELTQVRVTMANGSDTFTAGKINIQYE